MRIKDSGLEERICLFMKPLGAQKAVLVACAFLFLSTPSFAYLDPGTSAVLFQVGQIVLTSIVAAVTFFLQPLKALYYRLTGKKARPGAAATADPSPEASPATEPENGSTEQV